MFLRVPIMNYNEFSQIVQASKNCQRLVFRAMKFIKTGKIDLEKILITISIIWAYVELEMRVLAIGKQIKLSLKLLWKK